MREIPPQSEPPTASKAGSDPILIHCLADQSDPANDQYVFAYHIRIENVGETAVQLLSRHWVITDADGKVEEVRGAGVVGQQPKLGPASPTRYTSGSQFKTPVGTMQGSFQFVADDGVKFDAPIPKFVLSAKRVLHCQASASCQKRDFFALRRQLILASCSASLRCRESLPRTTHQMSATNIPPMPSVSTQENPESAFDHAEISTLSVPYRRWVPPL